PDPAGAAIAGATLLLSNGTSATTSAAGAYTMTAVPSGTYTATASAPTFNSTTTPGVAVTPGGVTTANFTLTPLPGTLQGVVTDTSGMPLAGAAVLLSSGTSTVTGPTGAYAFSSLTPATYGVTVTASGYNG